MSFSCMDSRGDVHALLAVVGDAVRPFALRQRDLIDAEATNRLANNLLLVVEVVSVDL